MSQFELKLIRGMTERGYSLEYAQRVFRQLEGFGSYGFPESHAASFASLVYVSSWIKCFYPDVFACALLNSMPMGFYQPAQIVIDAKNHDVDIRPVDINYSDWDNTLEKTDGKYHALRLGFRQVKSLREDDMAILIKGRTALYKTVDDLRKAGVSESALEKLADADAFRSIALDRRRALWEVSTKDRNILLFEDQPSPVIENNIVLPEMKTSEHVVHDYATTSLSLKAHPVSFVREKLSLLRVISTNDLKKGKNGDYVKVAGLVLVRQRPGTAGGVCFMTIEDETGYANAVIFEKLFDEYRKEILQSRLIMVEGRLQIEGEVIHIIVRRAHDFSKLLRSLTETDTEKLPLLTLSRADEKSLPPGVNKKTQIREDAKENVFPEARNFR